MPRKSPLSVLELEVRRQPLCSRTRDFAVTLFERNDFEGGKSASYEREGFVCDMGVHWTARGSNGPLGEVARRVGADL